VSGPLVAPGPTRPKLIRPGNGVASISASSSVSAPVTPGEVLEGVEVVVVVEEVGVVVEGLATVAEAQAGEADAGEAEARTTGVSEHAATAKASNSRLRCRATGGRIRSVHRLGGDV
jgi:hypothetical protein